MRKEEKPLLALAQDLEAQLQSIRRKMRRRLEAEYARGDVTGPQRLVMHALVSSEGMSLKELSARVSLAHSTVSGIVDRLEKRGFVNRHVLESDRRVTQITVSKPVSEFMKKQAPELALHPLLNALRRASGAERSAVRKGIETLERLLEE
ncbi:MAG: MarR family winged helix-turn-helix transcriptional regulator [Terracidiphilus sp.]